MLLFKNLTGNPYAGPPGSEIDQAWSNLLEPMNIRVTEAELKRTGQSSVALPEGGGSLAWLGVFHELHCIVGLPASTRGYEIYLTLSPCTEEIFATVELP